MGITFKDHFSHDPASYSKSRPGYPDTLFDYLASLGTGHELAWDCATGSGQSAVKLAKYFTRVIATDASNAQIANTVQHPGVRYRVASAENSGIESGCVDLLTVAQALHWFDMPAFAAEAVRVLKPGGILAVWTYNLVTITPEIDSIVNRFYREVLGKYWPPERRMVEAGYRDIHLPLDEIATPVFSMSARWNAMQLLDYLSTWSAVSAYRKRYRTDPLELVRDELCTAWGGDANTPYTVSWPLATRIWRKP